MDFLSAIGKFNKFASPISSGIGNISQGIQGIGGIANGIRSLFGSHSSERRQLRYQKDLMNYSAQLQDEMIKKQNEYNLDFWNKQNEYNSPASQLQRYRDAGLNTNLIYGGNGSVAGNSEAIQSGSGVGLNSNFDAKASAAQRQLDLQSAMQLKQIGVLDSQIEMNKAAASANEAKANLDNKNAGQVDRLADSITQLQDELSRLYNEESRQVNSFRHFFDQTYYYRFQEMANKWSLDRQAIQQGWYNIGISAVAMHRAGVDYNTAVYNLNKVLPATVRNIESQTNLNRQQSFTLATQAAWYVASAQNLGATTSHINSLTTWQNKLNSSPTYYQNYITNFGQTMLNLSKSDLNKIEAFWKDMGFGIDSGIWNFLPSAIKAIKPSHFKPSYNVRLNLYKQ